MEELRKRQDLLRKPKKPNKSNKDIPFEYHVMWVLQNYDKIAAQNHLLRHYLEQIPVSIVDDYNRVAGANGLLKSVMWSQRNKILLLEKEVSRLQDEVVQYKKMVEYLTKV